MVRGRESSPETVFALCQMGDYLTAIWRAEPVTEVIDGCWRGDRFLSRRGANERREKVEHSIRA
jgi:hypothetical protein